jgi:MATE family multidrug resistance protein
MGTVDTMVVGRVSAAAVGAVGLGSVIYHTIAVCGSGFLLGLDTLVSQAFGAKNEPDMRRSLVAGVWMALILTPLLMGIVWGVTALLPHLGVHPDVLQPAMIYIHALNWGTLPLALYFAFRRYLQAKNLARPIMIALVTANLINLAANWILVYGNLGVPAFGVQGSGWATCLSRIYMTLILAGAIIGAEGRVLRMINWRPDWKRIAELFKLGGPAALQLAVEISVWAVTALLISRLGPLPAAAHNVAMNVVSMTFMLPLGISSAAAVRVGHAIGRGDVEGARWSGWTALGLGAAVMSCAALTLLILPASVARLYSPDAGIVAAAAALLRVAAFFQLFDGLQIVATGALRGAGDTRTPAIWHFAGYWLVGLPLGATLCFAFGWGAAGLWVGLSLALILIGSILALVWHRKSQRVTATAPAAVIL